MKTIRNLMTDFRRFKDDRKGNIAIIFAASIIPIVVAVGSSVDYGNALQTRTRMQAALDAAAIAAAQTYASTGSTTDAQAKAASYYAKASDGVAAGQINTFNISTDGFLDVTASATISTTFLGVVGVDQVDISVASTAAMSGKELELSVMLDVTGSMSNDMADLKAASDDLLDIILRQTQKQRRVAIVPFSQAVNAGDYFDDITGNVNNDSDGDGWIDTIPSNTRNWCNYYSQYSYHWYWKQQCNPWRPVANSNCVTERTGSLYKKDDVPGPNAYFGMYDQTKHSSNGNNMSNSSCKPGNSPIIPLTDNRSILDDAIDNMNADGYTSGHLGTQFAWFMLSPKWNNIWPQDSQAGAYGDEKLLKVAIIMTDGEYNTWYSSGNGNSWEQARDICAEMKAAGVEVYTIGFDMQAGNSTTTLQQCASSSEHYFFPYDGQALRQVFRDIGAKIALAADGVTLAN